MNINLLAEKALKHHVNRAGGAGEAVDYTHKTSGLVELGVMCYPQTETEDVTTTDHISDKVIFRSLFLEEIPAKNDLISHNGIEYKVDLIQKADGHYDITAYNKIHNLGARR